MPTLFSVTQLFYLWEKYHNSVHDPSSGVPCDANMGDKCYTAAFLSWLTADPQYIQFLLSRMGK